ncbi:uncharacterized protein LOC142331689 [Lycorma delicatula]|uniref:uncharacterized protein LOC142331689 n=1 Tax=Lycorma delicatula TaxID=130591 RepID=UPI003F50F6BB
METVKSNVNYEYNFKNVDELCDSVTIKKDCNQTKRYFLTIYNIKSAEMSNGIKTITHFSNEYLSRISKAYEKRICGNYLMRENQISIDYCKNIVKEYKMYIDDNLLYKFIDICLIRFKDSENNCKCLIKLFIKSNWNPTDFFELTTKVIDGDSKIDPFTFLFRIIIVLHSDLKLSEVEEYAKKYSLSLKELIKKYPSKDFLNNLKFYITYTEVEPALPRPYYLLSINGKRYKYYCNNKHVCCDLDSLYAMSANGNCFNNENILIIAFNVFCTNKLQWKDDIIKYLLETAKCSETTKFETILIRALQINEIMRNIMSLIVKNKYQTLHTLSAEEQAKYMNVEENKQIKSIIDLNPKLDSEIFESLNNLVYHSECISISFYQIIIKNVDDDDYNKRKELKNKIDDFVEVLKHIKDPELCTYFEFTEYLEKIYKPDPSNKQENEDWRTAINQIVLHWGHVRVMTDFLKKSLETYSLSLSDIGNLLSTVTKNEEVLDDSSKNDVLHLEHIYTSFNIKKIWRQLVVWNFNNEQHETFQQCFDNRHVTTAELNKEVLELHLSIRIIYNNYCSKSTSVHAPY